MATPTQAGFYPSPTVGSFPNARSYVIALHNVLRGAVAQQLGIDLPAISTSTNRFDVPGIAGLRFTVATSPTEASARFRRIRDVQQHLQDFQAWIAGVSALAQGAPASNAGAPPSLAEGRFENVSAILTLHLITPGNQQDVQYDTTQPMQLSAEAVRLLQTLAPQAARDDVWVGLLGQSIYWGSDVVVGVSLHNIVSVNYAPRSITTTNANLGLRLNSLRTSLRPARVASTTRRTRSQGPIISSSTSSQSRTRSGALFRGGGIPIVRASRNDFNYMNYRPQNSSAPIPASSLLPPMDLEHFRKNVVDATEIYRSDYLRTMHREEKNNMCWFAAICDLVNAASPMNILDFDCLLNHLNYARYQQGIVAHTMQSVREQGLSLEDITPVLKFFQKEVLVFNAADELIFRLEGSRSRNKRIKPYNWAFLMAHNHVYPIHDYSGRSHQQFQVKRHGDTAFGNSTIQTREEFLDTASPMAFMFPYHLRMPSKDLRLTSPDVPEAQRLVHILYRDTSLFQLLMQPRFEHKDRSVVVLLDRKDNLEEMYLRMVHEFNHRPEAFFMKTNMVQLSSTSHGHYQGLLFKRMGYLNTKNDPDMITSTDQYLYFERKSMEFRRILYKTDHLSFVNASTFDIFEKFTRMPFVGPYPGANRRELRNACAVDFNRLYGHALQTLDRIPVLFPYSKFRIPTPQVQAKFPLSSFVLGRVHGKRTAYLHQDYMLLYYPHLKDHMNNASGRSIVYQHNPVFNHRSSTVFEVLLYCEVTQLIPLGDSVSKYMRSFWAQPGIPKSAKKLVFNTSIGMLGTKRNDLKAFYKGIIVDSPEEMGLLGENYTSDNYNIQALDESNFAVLPVAQKCVNRYQTGMVMYQTIVDSAVLRVANYIDRMEQAGVTPLQIQTDEIYFPASQLSIVEKFVHPGDPNDFDSNGLLKISKVGNEAMELPEAPTINTEEYGAAVHAMVEVQRSEPRFADYEMLPADVDMQQNKRLLLTASVPGAGKTHRVATQPGVTGVIAVPTNALAVDLQTKFPHHNVVTIHRLLSKVGRAFGLMDMLQEKEVTHRGPDEEAEDTASIPTKIFREGDTFLCIDEIYMLPTQVLLALYHFLHFLPENITHVYATGDPYQLDPVEDRRTIVNSGSAREAMIIRMFKKRIKLTKCRRMNSDELNRRVEVFCSFLRTNRGLQHPELRVQALTSVCQEHNVTIIREYHQVVDIMKAQTDMLVAAYTNETCHRITKHVLGSIENKLIPGTRLINRRRIYIKGGHRMHLNYIYEVKDVNVEMKTVLLCELRAEDMSDDDEVSMWVDADHVLKHMHWHRTRTAHCLQGTSWNGGVIVCDTDRRHLVNRAYFYVTMTRARDFDRLFVYIPH